MGRTEAIRQRTGTLVAVSIGVALLIFLFDLATPLGVVGGVPYVLLIMLSFWLPGRYTPVWIAAIATLLTVTGHFYSPAGAPQHTVLTNLALELFVLWVTAYLVTRYRRSERTVRDSEVHLRALVDTAVDGVIVTDAAGIVQDYNPACERLFGYSAEEIIGRNVAMLIPALAQDANAAQGARTGSAPQPRILGMAGELEGRRRDGSVFPLELSIGESVQEGEQAFVGIIRDITARKANEAALQAAKEQAEAASHAKSLFLANMSHEIRTPMNAILGYAQVLERDPELPAAERPAVRAVLRAGNYLMELIDDILDLSKIEAGAMQVEHTTFDLQELVDELGDMFRVRCEQKRLDWRVESHITQAMVHGDAKKLRQVLINLLGNAVKFTEHGSVTLRIDHHDSHYTFAVTDTGPGISSEERQAILEPFHQGDQGVVKGGTGLGLTLSQRQIQVMGGELEITSQPGEGSRFAFSVVLPPAAASAPAGLRQQRVLRLAPGEHVDALVVDDVEDSRDVLRRLLEVAGVTVRVAEDGRAALARVQERPPDIVFMDVRMPTMDGAEALHHMKQTWCDERIVCLAVTASDRLRRQADDATFGFDGLITKPFHVDEIYAMIERHLGVSFEREPLASEETAAPRVAPDLEAVSIAQPLHERLQRAAQVNAVTEIEAGIAELRQGDEPARRLADYLQDRLDHYDTQGIVTALERVSYARRG